MVTPWYRGKLHVLDEVRENAHQSTTYLDALEDADEMLAALWERRRGQSNPSASALEISMIRSGVFYIHAFFNLLLTTCVHTIAGMC